MLEFLQWAAGAFWLRCFIGVAVITLVGLFYNFPILYAHIMTCFTVLLLVIGLSDLLFGFTHPILWMLCGIMTVVMIVRGYLDEKTEQGQELQELREQKALAQRTHEQFNKGLSDDELRAMMLEDPDDDESEFMM